MKILVVHLLRYGDLFMAATSLSALRQRYPAAQIDLLVNEGLERLQPLMPMVDRFITFPREILQKGLVEIERPLFEPLEIMQSLVQKLNAEGYEKVINLTQNKLSGYFCALLQCEDKIGLTLNAKEQPNYGSPWFQYLNDVVGAGAKNAFHYADIHYYGMGLPRPIQTYTFIETEKGKKEAEDFFAQSHFTSGRQVLLQLNSSDEKKDWPISKWGEMLQQFSLLEPGVRFIMLEGPGEKLKVAEQLAVLRNYKINIDSACVSFEGALSLMQACDLLITTDTSIKHLAAGTALPILEISLGSGNPYQTGVFRKNSLILQSLESCAPCGHSAPCSQPERYCATKMDAVMVGTTAFHYMNNNRAALRELAKGYDDVVKIYLTAQSALGFWYPDDLAKENSESELSGLVDRAAWQFLLEREHLRKLAAFGSESLLLREQLESAWQTSDRQSLKILLEQMEVASSAIEEKLNRLLAEISRRLRQPGGADLDFIDQELKSEIGVIESSMGLGKYLSEKVQLPQDLGLYRIRKLQMSLNEVFQHQQIKIKLLRSIKNQLTEPQ